MLNRYDATGFQQNWTYIQRASLGIQHQQLSTHGIVGRLIRILSVNLINLNIRFLNWMFRLCSLFVKYTAIVTLVTWQDEKLKPRTNRSRKSELRPNLHKVFIEKKRCCTLFLFVAIYGQRASSPGRTVGGVGKGRSACNYVSGIWIYASKKSIRIADWRRWH